MAIRVLSLDIGLTTGYAVVYARQDDWPIIAMGVISEKDFAQDLRLILSERRPDKVIAERPVIIRGDLGDRLADLIAKTKEVVPQVEWFDAASWKQSPVKKHPMPRGIQTHTKDAIRFAIWYLGRL